MSAVRRPRCSTSQSRRSRDDINAAKAVSLDDSGRLVLTTDGVAKTINSPLENLAIYKALMTTGTIPGITDPVEAQRRCPIWSTA